MPSQWERFKQGNIAKIVIGYSLVVWVLTQLFEAVPLLSGPYTESNQAE